MDNKRLYVGNLPWSIRNENLKDLFMPFGEVTESVVITDKYSGRSKGFGFVTFTEEQAAQDAVAQMHEKEVEGRKIIVNIARPKEDRPQRSNFRNGGGRGFGGGNGGFGRDNRSY